MSTLWPSTEWDYSGSFQWISCSPKALSRTSYLKARMIDGREKLPIIAAKFADRKIRFQNDKERSSTTQLSGTFPRRIMNIPKRRSNLKYTKENLLHLKWNIRTCDMMHWIIDYFCLLSRTIGGHRVMIKMTSTGSRIWPWPHRKWRTEVAVLMASLFPDEDESEIVIKSGTPSKWTKKRRKIG